MSHFTETLNELQPEAYVENLVTPMEIQNVIKGLNKNSACVLGDVPLKIISLFSTELSTPICHLINSVFETGKYPHLWKRELITPVPKINPPPSLDKLRPISGLFNVAKIADRVISKLITDDMTPKRDKCQYGNQKGLSVNHYLINMIHQILLSLDKNTNKEKMSVILNIIDWSKAF